MAIDLHWP
jgi:RNA-binding protein 5/10